MFVIAIKHYLGRSGWTVTVHTNSQDFAEDRLYHYLVGNNINQLYWNWTPTSNVILELLSIVKGEYQ